MTVEEMERRMNLAKDIQSFYGKAYEDLKALRDKLAKGKTVSTHGDDYKKVIQYLSVNAPLYVNETDRDLKHLALLVLKGADTKQIACEWLNPNYSIAD